MEIVHFADAHIGVSTHGKLDPETGLNDRVVDFLDAFDYIIDYIEEHNIDLALFAGDMFHSNNPSPSLVSEVAIRIKEISQLCPLVMVPGNHDQAAYRVSAVDVFAATQMENVYIDDAPHAYMFDTKAGHVLIGALPYPTYQVFGINSRNKDSALDLKLAVDEQIQRWEEIMHGSTFPKILLAHGTVQGANYGEYKGTALGHDIQILVDTVSSGWDYVAMGHIHMHQDLTKGRRNACPVVYSGSIERVDFGEQGEAKGFVHVTIDSSTSYKFVEIPARPLVTLRIDVTGSNNPNKALKKHVINAKIPEDALVRVIIDANNRLDVDDNAVYDMLHYVHRVVGVQVKVTDTRPQRIELEEGESIQDLTSRELLEEWLMLDDKNTDDIIDDVLDIFDDITEELL